MFLRIALSIFSNPVSVYATYVIPEVKICNIVVAFSLNPPNLFKNLPKEVYRQQYILVTFYCEINIIFLYILAPINQMPKSI